MRLLRILATVLCLGLCAAAQQTPALVILPATLDSGAVRFSPSASIDWAKLARQHFKRFSLDHPDNEQILRQWSEVTNHAVFEFDAPLPPGPAQFYYLLSESGVTALKPEKLAGSVSYETDGTSVSSAPPAFDGVMVARPASSKATDAGFVLISATARTFDTSPVPFADSEKDTGIFRRVVEKQAEYSYNDSSGHHGVLARHALAFPLPKKAYLLKVSGEASQYLFLRWTPDKSCAEGCCESGFSLYRLDQQIVPVLDNFYDCDA
jgi:hypothetical protein